VGLSHPRYNPWRRRFAAALTALVVLANVSFPLAVLSGLITDARVVASARAR
jgi:hypothetical protein